MGKLWVTQSETFSERHWVKDLSQFNIVAMSDILMSLDYSSSDEGECDVLPINTLLRNTVPRVSFYVEQTIAEMNNSLFASHFRLNRSSVEALERKVY